MENWWPKNGSIRIEKQKKKKQFEGARDRQTDGQTESTTKNKAPSLDAEINEIK